MGFAHILPSDETFLNILKLISIFILELIVDLFWNFISTWYDIQILQILKHQVCGHQEFFLEKGV